MLLLIKTYFSTEIHVVDLSNDKIIMSHSEMLKNVITNRYQPNILNIVE